MRPRKPMMIAVAGAVALTLSATGCSKVSDTSAPGGAASPPNAAPAPTLTYDGPEASLPPSFPDQPPPGRNLTIGLLNPNEKIPALAQMQAGVTDEVTRMGGTLVAKDSQLDFNTQVNQFQELLARHVDAIVVYPLNPNALAPQIAAAKAAGIPVAAINTPIQGDQPLADGYVANVLQGFDRAAFARAQYVASAAPGSSYGLLGLGVPVGTLQFFMERQRYWADKFGLHYVGRQDAQSDDPKGGAEAMTGLLGQQPDIGYVFTYNDVSALGAAGAARTAGSRARVLGSDASDQSTLDAVQAGQLFASYRVDQYNEGYQAAAAAFATLAGRGLDPAKVVVGGKIVTKDNAASMTPTGPLTP